MGPQRMYSLTPWVRRLLVANLVVFLLQMTVFVDRRFLHAFAFAPLEALERPWTFLTYMFLHAGPLHLAFNLLMLFFFGGAVEDRMGGGGSWGSGGGGGGGGGGTFIRYYLLCGLGGAVLSFALTQAMPVTPMIGASGAILGVAVAFAWYWPDHPVFVFPFPEPIAAKWLVTIFVAVDLVLAALGMSDGVAHLAHLGGVGAGLIALKTQDWRVGRAERHLRRVSEPSVLVTQAPPPRTARSGGAAPESRSTPEADARAQAEIDRVLDKINASGIESLTPAERKFLTVMSRRYRHKS